MSKSSTMRRGRIEFFDDVTNEPRRQDATTAVIYYQRCFQNCDGERGGWWIVTVWSDARFHVAGPYAALSEAARIGRQIARRFDAKFIPATPEEIAQAEHTAQEWLQDAAAAGEAAE
jgi:hypothetical protein